LCVLTRTNAFLRPDTMSTANSQSWPITWSDTNTAPLLRKNKQINTVPKHTVTHQVWRISNDDVKPLCMLLRQMKGLVIVIEGEVAPILSKAVVILKQMGRHSWKAFLQFTTRQHSLNFNSTPSPEPQKPSTLQSICLFTPGGGEGGVLLLPHWRWTTLQMAISTET
jgi:hypothetical protein